MRPAERQVLQPVLHRRPVFGTGRELSDYKELSDSNYVFSFMPHGEKQVMLENNSIDRQSEEFYKNSFAKSVED